MTRRKRRRSKSSSIALLHFFSSLCPSLHGVATGSHSLKEMVIPGSRVRSKSLFAHVTGYCLISILHSTKMTTYSCFQPPVKSCESFPCSACITLNACLPSMLPQSIPCSASCYPRYLLGVLMDMPSCSRLLLLLSSSAATVELLRWFGSWSGQDFAAMQLAETFLAQ